MLAALYTDSCALSPLGKIAVGLDKLGVRNKQVSALASRKPYGIPKQKVFSSDRMFWSSFAKGRKLPGLVVDFKKWGLQGTNIVYNIYGENLGFLEWAKRRGCKIIVDVIIHPGTKHIVEREAKIWSVAGCTYSFEELESENEHSKLVFALADILLAPSLWVAEGIRALTPEFSSKIRLLPYGSSVAPVERTGEPEDRYFLFAGREPLRKGLHYLAQAAALVHQKYPEWEFKVAGLTKDQVSWIPDVDHLSYLGPVPMNEMRNLYKNAWAFLFPSLSEGQAGVVLESMVCGCPVIATKESGIDFDPGCGVTVPVCNAAMLAEAVIAVIDNRQKRNELSNGALRQATTFSMGKWKERLVSVMEEVAT